MIFKILGGGCAKCNKLEENVRKAVSELKLEAEILKIKDMGEIMEYGVMQTPALVINEEVKSCGKVLSSTEICELIKGIHDV